MKNIKSFVGKHWFGICVVLVVLLAGLLRFYNYDVRWALAHDQARDALVAREALRQHIIPVLGSFSQAGSFVMGPIWYWLLTIATAFYPQSILTPWVAITLSYVAVVYLMILIGKELGGKWLGLLVGLFTAVSPSQIAQSSDLINPSGVAIFSVLSIYFAIKYIKTKKNIFLFLFPFFVALAINIHLQAIGLVSLILVTLILQKPNNIKSIAFLFTGFILPFVPLIIFDLRNNFYDLRSLIDYYLYGQYRIYVPNRWLTYVGLYWPSAWAYIIGGQKTFGYLSIYLLSIFTPYLILKGKITKPLLSIILSFLLIFIMLRFYRGERFDSYLIFAHPFVLILTGWVSYNLFKLNRTLGFLVIVLLVLGNVQINSSNIFSSTNSALAHAKEWDEALTKAYPDKKFKIYDFQQKYKSSSLPLSLYLDLNNKIDDNGTKVGLVIATSGARFAHRSIYGERMGWQLLDLSSSTSAELSQEGWFIMNPSAIYHDTQDWYKGKKL